MLRLYVMRHAKSSWAVPGARDFDRELNDRGRSDLEKIGRVLSHKNYVPETIICSSAVRTVETYEGIKSALAPAPRITFTQTLYSSGVDDYMRVIHESNDTASLMIIGHNPMCGSLAYSLIGNGDPAEAEKISYKYPTATVTVLDFELNNWSEVAFGTGILRECLIPSKL